MPTLILKGIAIAVFITNPKINNLNIYLDKLTIYTYNTIVTILFMGLYRIRWGSRYGISMPKARLRKNGKLKLNANNNKELAFAA